MNTTPNPESEAAVAVIPPVIAVTVGGPLRAICNPELLDRIRPKAGTTRVAAFNSSI